MLGNEVADKLHNFFEQGNSPQSHQTHAGPGLWPILNINPWVSSPNGMPSSSNSNNSSAQSLDYERENGSQSSQVSFNANPHQFGLNPEFGVSHPRVQQLSLNEQAHGLQGLQNRSKQAGFLDDGMDSNRPNSMFGRFASYETQTESTPDYSSGHIRISERPEDSKTPVNFDFLGQQQLMRTQHMGSPPQTRHNPGFSGMQLLQQQLFYRQLQDFQRQQQLRHLDQGTQLQNLHGQLSIAAKQVGNNQSPAPLNGIPINDASSTRSSNFMGVESKTQSNSQMFVAGNVNLSRGNGSPVMYGYSNGLMFPQEQVQSMLSMGITPQQLNSSLPGVSASGNRGSLNQHSQFHRISPVCADVMTEAGGDMQSTSLSSFQSDQGIRQQDCLQACISVNTCDYQAKSLFGNASVQNRNTGVMSSDLQQIDASVQNIQPKDSSRQEQSDWSQNLHEKSSLQLAPFRGGATLDPTEEKFLYGTGNDDTWGTFGSWSALVEDAVRCSSEDKGNHEGWNGPGLENGVPITLNHSTVSIGNGKQNAAMEKKNRDSSSSLASKPFPLFNVATPSPISLVAPSFQHSLVESAYGHDDQGTYAPRDQQSTKETKLGQFDQSQMKNKFVETGLIGQMNAQNANYGVLPEYSAMQSVHSSDAEASPGNLQGAWDQHQNSPLKFVRSQHTSRSNGQNAEESLPHNGNNALKFHDNYNTTQYSQRNEPNRAMRVENNYDGSIRNIGGNHEKMREPEIGQHMQSDYSAVKNLDNLEVRHEKNRQVGSRHLVDIGKHVGFDPSLLTKDVNMINHQYQRNMGPRASDSLVNYSDRASDQTSEAKQHAKLPSSKDHTSNQSFLDQHTNGVNSPSHTSYYQGLSQSVTGGHENKGQGYPGHPQLVGRADSNDALDMGQDQFSDLHRNAKEAEQMQPRDIIPSHKSSLPASFGGYTAPFPQNIRTSQSSQNMLDLLHKVDRSREANNLTRIGFPDQNLMPDMPKTSAIDLSAPQSQHNESSSIQGFGLRLAPPSNHQLVPTHDLPPSTSVNDFNAVQVDPYAGKGQIQSSSTTSVHLMRTEHERPQRESWNNISNGQTSEDTSHSIDQGNSLTVSTYGLVGKECQIQKQQQNFDAPGVQIMDQSINVSRAEINMHVKHASLQGRTHESHDQSLTQNSIQELLPSVSGRIPPFRIPSSDDSHAPTSQFNIPDSDRFQPSNASINQRRSSGQQPMAVEARSSPQAPASSGMSHQAGYPSMFRNVRTSVSAQQRLAGVQPCKLTPSMLQSMILSSSGRGANSGDIQKANDQSNKGGNAPSCTTSPYRFADRKEHRVKDNSSRQTLDEKLDVARIRSVVSQSQEAMPKSIRDVNSSARLSSLGHQQPQEASERRDVLDSSTNYHKEHVSPQTVDSSSSNIGPYEHLLKPLDGQLHTYSLLQQMQAMKSAECDSGEKVGKGLKGADSGSDASQKGCDTGQKFIYGHNSLIRFPVDSGLPESASSSFPPDAKMLSFSRENEEASASTSSQFIGRELPSQDRYSTRQLPLRHDTQPLDTNSVSNFMGGKYPQISPQMAPSWFEQYGAYKKGQILDSYDKHAVSQQRDLPRVSECTENDIVVDQRTDIDQVGSLRQAAASSTMVAEESYSLPLDDVNHHTLQRLKKRKSTPLRLLSWYKEVTQGSQRLQTTSLAEMDWTQATNMLIEKVEDDSEMIEDGIMVPRSRRRLNLTTRLMQHLLPAGPAAMLSTEASSAFDSLTYFVAKASLADACSMASYSKSNSLMHRDNENMMPEKLQIFENVGGHVLSKNAEDFIGRSNKFGIDLSRLEKRASILDLRVESQELERFSIISRLAKFHGRSQTDGVESSLTSESAYRKTFPQRYVTAYPMPGNLPEGVHCLSL